MCNKYGYHIIVNKINDMYKESIKCILIFYCSYIQFILNSLAVHTVFSVQINMKIPEKQNNQKQLKTFRLLNRLFLNLYKIFRTRKNIHETYTRQNVHMKAA